MSGIKLCGNQLVGMLNIICGMNFDTGKVDSLKHKSYLDRSGIMLARFHSQFDDYLRSMVLRRKRNLFDADYQDDGDR